MNILNNPELLTFVNTYPTGMYEPDMVIEFNYIGDDRYKGYYISQSSSYYDKEIVYSLNKLLELVNLHPYNWKIKYDKILEERKEKINKIIKNIC